MTMKVEFLGSVLLNTAMHLSITPTEKAEENQWEKKTMKHEMKHTGLTTADYICNNPISQYSHILKYKIFLELLSHGLIKIQFNP